MWRPQSYQQISLAFKALLNVAEPADNQMNWHTVATWASNRWSLLVLHGLCRCCACIQWGSSHQRGVFVVVRVRSVGDNIRNQTLQILVKEVGSMPPSPHAPTIGWCAVDRGLCAIAFPYVDRSCLACVVPRADLPQAP